MKPQQLAALLNISPVTLRRWAGKEFAEFLSPSAQGQHGAKRSFTEHDARIIAWIAQMKAQNTPIDDMLATLRSDQTNNWNNMPPLPGGMSGDTPVAMVPREAVEERVRALQEQTRLQIGTLERERDELKAQLAETRRERDQWQTRLDRSEVEKSELQRQMYELHQRIILLTERLAGLLESEQRRRK